MIGADDLADFYDPEEFGCEVLIVGSGGGQPAKVLGMWGEPAAFGLMLRQGTNVGAAQIRAKANQRMLQVSNEDVPVDWHLAKVIESDREFSIAEVTPHGRLRSLMVLVPYGDRQARVKDPAQNGWLPTQPKRDRGDTSGS
jgi:hypothetical protein